MLGSAAAVMCVRTAILLPVWVCVLRTLGRPGRPGVTRPVSLAVDSVDPTASGSFTARARVRIDRTEFGITARRGLAGRYLELSVEVLCVRR